jgi:uncharacterized protein YdcH (DUF465 family)
VLVATLVPAVLIAAATLVRIVPVVEAKAGAGQAGSGQASGQAGSVGSGTAGAASGQASDSVAGQVSTADSDVDTGRMAPVAPVGPVSPVGPDAIVVAPEPPTAIGPIAPVAPVAPVPPVGKHGSSYTYSTSDDGDAYAIVQDGGNTTMMMNGRHNNDFEKVRKQYPGKFIWYEHDGKSYVITDPKILADSQSLFQANRPLQLRQEELNRMQQKLNREMADLKPEIDRASIPGPEFREQMAKLNAQLAELQSDKFKKLSDQIAREVADNQKLSQKEIQELTQEKLGELQEKIGDIQGRIGEIQGKIGEKQGELGEKQGEIGERMGKLGEEMGRIGEEEGRIAEEASRKMKLMLDQAVRDGKAKPVD